MSYEFVGHYLTGSDQEGESYAGHNSHWLAPK